MVRYVPVVARYSKRGAMSLVSRLRKYPKLSIQPRKPRYKVSKERYKGKYTDRWIISQDSQSYNRVKRLNS